MVKYSFIVPVYNCEAYLKECVESLLGQRGGYSFEVILVDDGAQDRSGQIAEELAEKHPQVRTFHKENGGAASARNYGMEQAAGKYLLFIDGDDTVDDSLLETVDSHLEKSQQPLIIYGMSFDYYKGENLQRTEKLSCRHDGEFSVGAVLDDFSQFFWDNALSSTCNKVFSAEVIYNANICFQEDMNLYEDLDFALRYLTLVDRIWFIDKPLYHYRHDVDNLHLDHRISSLQKVESNMSLLLKTTLALCDSFSTLQKENQVKNTIANLFMQLLSAHLLLNEVDPQRITEYCSNANFRAIMHSGAILNQEMKALLNYVDKEAFLLIKVEFIVRKIRRRAKRAIKKRLGK